MPRLLRVLRSRIIIDDARLMLQKLRRAGFEPQGNASSPRPSFSPTSIQPWMSLSLTIISRNSTPCRS